jgi:glycosyltransferase involved in cell wall biosynthesis
MHVLHIINCLSIGGAETLLVNLLPSYKKNNIKVSLLELTSNETNINYKHTLEANGINVYSLHHIGTLYNPIIIFKLNHFFKSHTFDIIHVHLFPAQYWVALSSATKFAKLVTTEHSTANSRQLRPYFKPIENFIYKKYNNIIAITKESESNLKSWLQRIKHKIVVIPNGIDIQKIKDTQPIQGFKKQNGIEENDIIIAMFASFNKYKDHNTLLKAMLHLPANYKLTLSGEGPLKKESELFVQQNNLQNQVKFLGFRQDALAIMKSVDIVILSSFGEGLSGVTIESIASGAPFIGSDVLGINNIVENKNCLFEVSNVKMLVEKIILFTTSKKDREENITINQSKIQQFDIANMLAKHIELYQSLTN